MNTNSSARVVTNVPEPLDIRDIKAPIEIPSGWLWLWWSLAVVAAAVLAWGAWRKWRKKAADVVPAVVVPPHERARQKLNEALGLIDQPRPFCTAVSDSIRVYLEERFSLRAPERTTEEFLDELQSSAVLGFEQKRTLGEFLARCDLVKFARYEPREVELRDLHESAMRLVSETEPPPPVPDIGQRAAARSP